MLITKMPKILIVGSGLTGSLVASSLRHHLKENVKTPLELSIWDKARGTGGRMSTSRSPHDSNCTVDLGAQYISCTPQYGKQHKKLYEELLSEGILEPLKQTIVNCHEYEAGTKHFVAPNGVGSIVKFFINQSGCQPEFNNHISSITRTEGKWCVSTLSGRKDLFDAVVLTIPTPQILNLEGTIVDILEKNQDIKQKLEMVCYSARFALGLYYDHGTELNLPFSASYLDDSTVIRFIAVDNLKRNRPELPPSVVVHSNVGFGSTHVEKTPAEVEPLMKAALEMACPNLPIPKATKCHKWRYSQVRRSYEGTPGVVELSQEPLLLLGGDAFTHSNFDGCKSSADKIVQHLVSKFAAKL